MHFNVQNHISNKSVISRRQFIKHKDQDPILDNVKVTVTPTTKAIACLTK